ncbi:MAG: hypothetical protein QXU47_03140 [Candidatus Bathyarchaeia archaeon]
MKRLILSSFSVLIVMLIFTISIGFSTENVPETIVYVDGRWIRSDGTTLKLSFIQDPGIHVKPRTPDFLMMPYEEYLKLSESGKPIIKAMKVICQYKDTGVTKTFAVVEPKLIIIEYPISGSLSPGYGHLYGKFCSCVQIEVEVTWTPGDQVLGIGIVDADTGKVTGYWYTGGSALAVFSTDWTKCYYICILSYHDNTKIITYNGVIRCYVW